MSQHNRWLSWKMRHGLAGRGRASHFVAKPRGIVANICYWVYFKWQKPPVRFTEKPGGGRLYYQDVGGSVGAAGKVNGD